MIYFPFLSSPCCLATQLCVVQWTHLRKKQRVGILKLFSAVHTLAPFTLELELRAST